MMSEDFISLARKWRPRNLSDIVGQEYVVRALQNAARENRLHHALLFSGTRGIGKTTLARIVAMLTNCTGRDAETADPCLQCELCQDIMAGRLTDVIEQDAASHTQVDKMRELLERASYAPARARHKVFIIDEVHMLTRQSFNAMLKTLEEPPPHVKFILATTDPQKLPATVRSRCLCFSLQPLTREQIGGRLSHILEAEKIPYQPAAVSVVARLADGSMRDALSILDQAVAHRSGELQAEDVRRITGDIGIGMLADILRAVAAGDAASIEQITAQHIAQHISFDVSLVRLSALIYKIALAQALDTQRNSHSDDEDEAAIIQEMSGSFSAEQLQVLYEISIRARTQLALAPDAATGFSMALLRMTLFRPAQSLPAATPSAAPQTTPPVAPPQAAPQTPPAQQPPSAGSWQQTMGQLDGQAQVLAAACIAKEYSSSGVQLILDADKAGYKEKYLSHLERELRRLHGESYQVEVTVGTDNAADKTQRERLLEKARTAPLTRNVQEVFPDAVVIESSVREQ